jgi:plastocyanin
MPTRLLPALCLVVVALAACGGGEKSAGSGSGGGSPSSASSASDGNTVAVQIKDILFVPERVSARVGQTVKWTNEDSIVHDVTARTGADFESEKLSKGDTFTAKLTKAGTIGYVCTIHPDQKGTIAVSG